MTNARRCPRPTGLGLVELMVSLALGLLLSTMVLGLLGQMARHRVETGTVAAAQRHFQTVTDRLGRDLRRAGHHRSASLAPSAWSWVDISRNKATWVYEAETSRSAATAGPLSSDNSGVRISNGALQIQLGLGNWQALNDPSLLWVDTLDVLPVGSGVSPGASPCPALGAQVSVQARPVVRGSKGPPWVWRTRIEWPAHPGVRRDAVVVCAPQTGDTP